MDDAKILQLARAGDTDFAMPSGAAQNVVLINEGFFRVFGSASCSKTYLRAIRVQSPRSAMLGLSAPTST